MTILRYRKEPVILVTGFEPFGGGAFNPSGCIADKMDEWHPPSNPRVRVKGLVLPVAGNDAFDVASAVIRRLRPFLIVAMGVSRRNEISLETTAVNAADYPMQDNAGEQPRGIRILRRGSPALHTGLDLHVLAKSLEPGAVPIRVSRDAGTFVCNWFYYRLLHLSNRAAHPARRRTLFIHLPPVPGPEGTPGKPGEAPFTLQQVDQAVREAIDLLSAEFIPGRYRPVPATIPV